MRTRSQTRKRNRRQQQRTPPVVVKPFDLEEPFVEQNVIPMADNRTMAQLLEAPTVGYEDAIVVPEINEDNFELKHGLLTLVQNKQFFGHDKEDPHAHIRYFNKITSTMRFPNVPSTSVKLMLFPFSLEGAARMWLEKEPPRSILTWDDLVSKFINKFFPPSKTTNLRNEITEFQQRFEETFYEAWDRFNDLLRACPHHGFSEIQQIDTFYNALNSNDQDSLNSAAGGNFLDKMPRECLRIIEKSEPNPETSTEKVQNPNLENTAQVPPPKEKDSIFIEIPKPKVKKTVNVEIQEPNSPKPNSYQPKLPYPERMKVREHDKPSAQHSRNNEKLEEIAITTVNAECSAIIMNKVPDKLEDLGKFLIPCALQDLDRTNALADFGASINLLPHSIYKQLEFGALTPTRMTLELANRSITHPMGIAEDVVVRVDGFTFHADFFVVNFEPDPRVPIILGRPFLRTAKALIDFYEETLTLRVGKDELVYYANKSKKNKEKHSVHVISVIDFSKDDPFSGSTTTHSDNPSPSSSPMKTSDNFEKFADELAPLDSLPPGNDDSTFKKDLHEENFQVYSNPLFEFDDTFKSNSINPLFDEMENVEIENTNVSNEPVLPQTPLSNKDECFDPGDDSDEIEEFLAMEILKEYNEDFYDSEGDVLFLDNLLCDEPTSNPSPQNESNHETFSLRNDPLHHEFTRGIIINSSMIAREHKEYLLCEISSSLPPNVFHTSLSTTKESPIPVEDSEPVHEEIDLVLGPDEVIPLGVENDDSKDEDNSTFLPENESSILEPSSPRPPLEPPDDYLRFKPILAIKEDFYQSEKVLPLNDEDVNSFTFVYSIYLKESPLFLSFRSEDFVFDPGIVTFHFFLSKAGGVFKEISFYHIYSP
ncbi:reverse transcriptase domain-containing protein [Tanacetum coccineum]